MLKKTIAALLASGVLFTCSPIALAYDSLTYLYGGTTATYLARMEKTADNLNVVSPDYYETANNGGVIYTKMPDPLLIAAMHDKNIKVVSFFSNHWNRDQARAMLERRVEAAEFLSSSVVSYGLDGIDIDLQNINENDRDNFSDFIRLLSEKLPKEKNLTVCQAHFSQSAILSIFRLFYRQEQSLCCFCFRTLAG